VLYSKTETYFTVTDYHRVRGDEVQIRKCDVNMDHVQRVKASELAVNDQSKSVFKGCKEYDPSYIWGQLVGWFKQTVDKPNASLSADRRGTITMPEIDSFLITSKHQESMNTGVKRKKKQRGDSSESEEVMPTKVGSRTRPGKVVGQSVTKPIPQTITEPIEENDAKVTYPSRTFKVSHFSLTQVDSQGVS
jgi:hypothetical protein